MSYDVHIESTPCPTCGHEPDDDDRLNYTYNLGGYFRAVIPGGLQALDDKTGREAEVLLTEAISTHARLESIGHDMAQYEPDNGWGSVAGARRFLARILHACTASPDGKVRVT